MLSSGDSPRMDTLPRDFLTSVLLHLPLKKKYQLMTLSKSMHQAASDAIAGHEKLVVKAPSFRFLSGRDRRYGDIPREVLMSPRLRVATLLHFNHLTELEIHYPHWDDVMDMLLSLKLKKLSVITKQNNLGKILSAPCCPTLSFMKVELRPTTDCDCCVDNYKPVGKSTKSSGKKHVSPNKQSLNQVVEKLILMREIHLFWKENGKVTLEESHMIVNFITSCPELTLLTLEVDLPMTSIQELAKNLPSCLKTLTLSFGVDTIPYKPKIEDDTLAVVCQTNKQLESLIIKHPCLTDKSLVGSPPFVLGLPGVIPPLADMPFLTKFSIIAGDSRWTKNALLNFARLRRQMTSLPLAMNVNSSKHTLQRRWPPGQLEEIEGCGITLEWKIPPAEIKNETNQNTHPAQ